MAGDPVGLPVGDAVRRARLVDTWVAACKAAPNPRRGLRGLLGIARALERSGELGRARALAETAADVARSLADDELRAVHLNDCAFALVEFGAGELAARLVDEALGALRRVLPREFHQGRLNLALALAVELTRAGGLERARALVTWVTSLPQQEWSLGLGDKDPIRISTVRDRALDFKPFVGQRLRGAVPDPDGVGVS